MTNLLKLVELNLKFHYTGSVGIECRRWSCQVQGCKGKQRALCVCQKGLCLRSGVSRSGTVGHDTYSQGLGRFLLSKKVKVF